MIGWIANLAGPWRVYAELAIAVVLVGAWGVQTNRLHAAQVAEARADGRTAVAKSETAEVRQKWAQQAAEAASAGLAASERNRQLSAELARTKEEAEHALQTDRDAAARTAAALAAERDGLRKQLTAYAAGPAGDRGPANDSLAACVDRADRLGNLLVEGVRVQEDLANGAEAEARNVRTLLSSWPRVSD